MVHVESIFFSLFFFHSKPVHHLKLIDFSYFLEIINFQENKLVFFFFNFADVLYHFFSSYEIKRGAQEIKFM